MFENFSFITALINPQQGKLNSLYRKNRHGISPIHEMQQTLIQLNSVAAIVTVIAFKLHHPKNSIDLKRFLPKYLSDSPSPAVNSFKRQSIDETIENLLDAVSKGQLCLRDYAHFVMCAQANDGEEYALDEAESLQIPSSKMPILQQFMQTGVKYLNQILQGQLTLVLPPENAYKKNKTAVRKLNNEKGRIEEMTDLARMSMIFTDQALGDLFKKVLAQVPSYVIQNQSVSVGPRFLQSGLNTRLSCQWDEERSKPRIQKSGYFGDYYYLMFGGQSCEVQILHKSMQDVNQQTHNLHVIHRVTEQIIQVMNTEKKSSNPKTSDLCNELRAAIDLVDVSLTTFADQLHTIRRPSVNGTILSVTQNVMRVFGQKEKPVAETFNQRIEEFNDASKKVFSGELNQDSLQALATASNNLRQFLHVASVLGRENDSSYQELYTRQMDGKLSM
jgi:hypothetical protein